MKTKTMKREMWSTIAELKSDAPYICEERHDLYRRGDSISVTLTWEEPKPERKVTISENELKAAFEKHISWRLASDLNQNDIAIRLLKDELFSEVENGE